MLPQDMGREEQRLTRRRWLQLTGAAAALGLTGTVEEVSGYQPGGQALVSTVSVEPTQMQFNTFNPTNQGLWQLPMLVDQLAWLNAEKLEYKPGLAQEWTIGDDAVTLTLREGQTWHNGDPVTADDLVTRFRLGKFFEEAIWDYAKSVEATGDRTVELSLSSEVNEEVLKRTLLTMALDTPKRIFGEWLTRLQDASNKTQRESVTAELTEFTLEEPIGNGPFRLVDRNSRESTLKRHDGHPTSDRLNFDTIKNRFYEGNQGIWQALRAGNIDIAGVATPKNVYQNFPDNIKHTVKPIYRGMALYFNHQDDAYGDPLVRRAIAHIVRRKPAAKNAHSKYIPVERPTGIPKTDPWLDGVIDNYDRYQTDEERAAELLREAGYEKSNGQWVGSNGEPLKFPLKAPGGFSDWITGAQTVTSHVNQFGIDAELITHDIPTFFGEDRSQGNFRVLTNFWGGQHPYPYAGLKSMYEYDFPAYPDEWTVPARDGGGQMTVSPSEKLQQIARSAEGAQKPIRDLTWANNQMLPILPLWIQIGQGFVNVGEWTYPSEDSPVANMDVPYHIRAGNIKRKE